MNIQERIEKHLNDSPETRGSLERLAAHLWAEEIPATLSLADFFTVFSQGGLTPISVIHDIKIEIQKQNPQLRPSTK